MAESQEPEALGSPMRSEAEGNANQVIRKMARDQRSRMRVQARDDQVFAALLERVGGDEHTARVYWTLARRVQAYASYRPMTTTVHDILDVFEEDELDALSEQLSQP